MQSHPLCCLRLWSHSSTRVHFKPLQSTACLLSPMGAPRTTRWIADNYAGVSSSRLEGRNEHGRFLTAVDVRPAPEISGDGCPRSPDNIGVLQLYEGSDSSAYAAWAARESSS